MTTRHIASKPLVRTVWFRRGVFSSPRAEGHWDNVSLLQLAVAAARESFLTGTISIAGAWTGLYESMLSSAAELQWRDSGPGIGRDARIAHSSLLGRYMARAYLMGRQNVRVLVPLDEAKRVFRRGPYPYRIEKQPPGKALEADWIGLDDRGLIIAEAKGTFDRLKGAWEGPDSIPGVLKTAIGQAERTAVLDVGRGEVLKVRRWAIASRWGNETNGREPTLLAWESDGKAPDNADYRTLARLFHGMDVAAVLDGLGHPEAVDAVNAPQGVTRLSGDLVLRMGDRFIEPGFAAAFGPVGVYPLRRPDDVTRLRLFRESTPDIAIASLSSRYLSSVFRGPRGFGREETDGWDLTKGGGERLASRAGLTVAWPGRDEDIAAEGE